MIAVEGSCVDVASIPYLCRKYRLPDNLIPLFMTKNEGSLVDLNNICESQIKWLLRLGWKPPVTD